MALEIVSSYLILDELLNDKPDLSLEEQQRRDRRIPRISIRVYARSAFVYMFNSGNDQALLNCCAVDHKAFRELLALFEPHWYRWRYDVPSGNVVKRSFTKFGEPKGRKRMIDAIGCLGLVLYWYRTRGAVSKAIAMSFGLTASPMYYWLKFSRRVLLYSLQYHPAAKVSMPKKEEIEIYVEAIATKYPILREKRVWAAIDGLKLPIQQSKDWSEQAMYYNKWTCGTYLNSVFVFAPDGLIRMVTTNAPGSMHDSTIASYGLYQRMEYIFNRDGARVVVDQAFKLEGNKYLIQSSQLPTVETTPYESLVNTAATSVRQLSENGMRMIQGQFPRLKDPIALEEFGERKTIMNLMVLLYNFQTSRVGINIILNTFMSRTEGFDSYYAFTAGRLQEITPDANRFLRTNGNEETDEN